MQEKDVGREAMATAKTRAQLHRLRDLSLIRSALSSTRVSHVDQGAGLQEIAAVCAIRASARAARDCHALRDQLLTIACEWDLASEGLDDQSDTCLAAIADMLGR
jgi:hypothetical protein